MKREFLKNLGLSEEAIDKIMAENGNDINDLKTQIQATTTERDGFKDQLKQRDTDITELKKSAATADELKTKFAELETKYQKDTGDLSSKMAQQAFDAKLDLSLTGKVKNPKAARALLDIEKIKFKDGELDGLFSRWYVNGQKDIISNYIKGKKNGSEIKWSETGVKISEINYTDD